MFRVAKLVRPSLLLPVAAAALIAGAPAPALATDAALPFEAPRDRASYDRALQCLTQAIYYEARSESDEGQRAVAQVVLNRVRHPAYPNSVCGVVFQGSTRRTGCQFTFTCDGSLNRAIEAGAWARASRIAATALRGNVYRPVGLALNYHTTAIRPYWAPSLVRHAVIGSHIFYRRPDSGRIEAFRQAPSSVEPRAAYASVNAVARAPRASAVRENRNYVPARVEMARVERVTIERPTVERAASFTPPRSRRSSARPSPQAQAPAQATRAAAPARRGPRTSVENGVRVSRGS